MPNRSTTARPAAALAAALLLLCVAAPRALADVTADQLRGAWHATVIEGQPVSDTLSMSITFNADGSGRITTTSQGNTARVNFTYALNGNRLTLTLADPAGETVRFRAAIDDGELVLVDLAKRAESRLSR